MRAARLGIGALIIAIVLSGCQRAAEMIPGHGTTPTPRPPATTPTPIAAPPLLAPSDLRLAGSAGAGANRPAIPDADLIKAVVRVVAVDDASPPGVARTGGGVIVDRARNLVLTSYLLVQPRRPDGTAAYSRLLVGAGASADPPGFAATIVAANPQFDIAVLRLTGGADDPPRTGAPVSSLLGAEYGEAVPADATSLRRGDRLRISLPGGQGGQIATAAAAVSGFSSDGQGEPLAWLRVSPSHPSSALGAPVFDQAGLLVGFGTQIAYDPNAPVGLVRPLSRALEVIDRARSAPPNARYIVPLQHPPAISGTGSAAAARDGAFVSRPVFAENALEGPGFRDLFDYATIFRNDVASIDYEFFAQGIANGTPVQERWHLNGVLQDALSSSYTWSRGNFAVVSDRLTTPNARGIPTGAWTLEVWVADVVRATAAAYVGITPPDVPRKPAVDGFAFASTASPEQLAGERASAAAGQLLMFFNYRQAAGVQSLRWIVLRDGRTVYQSEALPWPGGERGTWWVGFAPEPGSRLLPGTWEFQLYFDNMSMGNARIDLR